MPIENHVVIRLPDMQNGALVYVNTVLHLSLPSITIAHTTGGHVEELTIYAKLSHGI